MSHQFTSGVFFNNEPAWHKLGTVLDGTQPAREAFAIANADWHTIGTPVFDPTGQPIPGYQAITRGDTGNVLSIQGESYTIVQNEQLIRVAEALHEDATMDAVVVLNEGRKVAFTAKVNNSEADVLPGDTIHQYLVGCTSHDGTIAFQVMFSPIRVVCQNTLSYALGRAAAGIPCAHHGAVSRRCEQRPGPDPAPDEPGDHRWAAAGLGSLENVARLARPQQRLPRLA
jgi:phage/plasmid-like protein (TIGR03299 family)